MIEFNNYLKDKKVIIVGPAYYLKGQQLGDYINQLDIVVRINEPMHAPLSKQDKIDFGFKTNIIYLPPSLTKIFITRQIKSTKGWGKKKVFTNADIVATHNRWRVRGLEWVVGRDREHRFISSRFNYLNMNEDWVTEKAEEAQLPKLQATGILAIKHLLESELQTLNIIGFDFYQTGYYHAKDNWKKGRPKIGTKRNPHLKYFKQLVESEDRLIIDDHLKGILDAN
jgi:hypothetical protein